MLPLDELKQQRVTQIPIPKPGSRRFRLVIASHSDKYLQTMLFYNVQIILSAMPLGFFAPDSHFSTSIHSY